jgi:tetratricopeptide (TPR) repeat protein
LKPEDVDSQRGLFRLYQYFLDNNGSNEAIAWLQQQKSEQARYFLGEAFRRAGKLAKADSIFRAMLAASPATSLVPLRLSLTRLYYQQKSRPSLLSSEGEARSAAEKSFWQAVDGIRDRLDAVLLFDDVKYIMTDVELQQFRQLVAAREYIDFFHRFFMFRDPTPAADNNVRLASIIAGCCTPKAITSLTASAPGSTIRTSSVIKISADLLSQRSFQRQGLDFYPHGERMNGR